MSKFAAHGTTVRFNSILVGNLTSIGVSGREKGAIEVTDSESGWDREYISGLREGGTLELEGRYDPEDVGYLQLHTNWQTEPDAVQDVVVTLPTQATAGAPVVSFQFNGFVTKLDVDLPTADDEPAMFTASIKVAGPINEVTV